MPSAGEEQLNQLLETLRDELGGFAFEREHVFHSRRKWRFDFAIPECGLAFEFDGGVHRISDRFARDLDKLNMAQLDGWQVLRFDRKMVNDGRAEKQIRRALGENIPKADLAMEPGERATWKH